MGGVYQHLPPSRDTQVMLFHHPAWFKRFYFPLLSSVPAVLLRGSSLLSHTLFFFSSGCAKPTCKGGGKAANRCFAGDLPLLRGWQVKQMTRVYFIIFLIFLFFLTPPHGKGAVCCQPGRCKLLMTAAEGAGSRCLLPHQSRQRYF